MFLKKKVKTVTAGMVKTVDDIYVLCPEEKVPEFVTDRGSVIYWEIKDPFDSSTENFRMIRDVIKEKVKKIIIFQ